ncbi:MAG TPA: hypothetical protein VN814_24795 [Caulobacteraceae bacterium]|nr:hypothetical protein [Caulobacteraceae bacterium]
MPRRRSPALIAAILITAGLAARTTAAQTPPAVAAAPASPLAIARCTWSALPATTRAALIASGPSIDDIGKAITGMSPALMQLAQSQCPVPATKAIDDAAKDAWAGTVLTNWAEGELGARYRVTPAALARAWSRVPAASRRQIAAGFDKTPDAVRGDVAGFATELGLTDPVALDLLSAWAIAQMKLAALN